MPFRIALSGLNAAQTDLTVTGNNVANAATNGFKRSRTEFSDVYAVAFEGIGSIATGNGVSVSGVTQNYSQGNVEFTDRNLDLAVSGQGFFIVKNDQGVNYTRAGSLHVDRDGYVVNQTGQQLQVIPPDADGNFSVQSLEDLGPLRLSNAEGEPQATSSITATLNLNATDTFKDPALFNPTDATTFNNSTSVTVYDSLGASHTATTYYLKTAVNNQWNVIQYADGNPVASTTGSPVLMTFNPDGTINGPTSIDYTGIPSGTGADPLDISVKYDATTQFGSDFTVNGLNQNGFPTGRLSGVDIDSSGVVFARFTNGQSKALGKIALANFSNVGGLRQQGDTNWAQSYDAGDLLLGEANTASFGLIQSGALEASNVDIAESLVNLITAQRNFQANAQVISAADQVTQTIINI